MSYHCAEKYSFENQMDHTDSLQGNAKDHAGSCHVVDQGPKGMILFVSVHKEK